MKRVILLVFLTFIPFIHQDFNLLEAQGSGTDYIIRKGNGKIIKAYLAFEDYLKSEKSWENYKKRLLDPFEEMRAVHATHVRWGTIDTLKFPEEAVNYKIEDFEMYFPRYNDKMLNLLYDSVISRENRILKPLNNNPVDLCIFLPYTGCFVIPGKERSTIYISMLIDTGDVKLIMVHEYAHTLHSQRRPEEEFTLGREVVSEGIAVYLTTYVLNRKVFSSIPFMPDSSVRWCFKNEQPIKDAIRSDLGDTTFTGLKKFIADGEIATPPEGFVEKTGFFAGYRIIDACIKKGMSIEEVCSLNSKEIIDRSGYFK